LAVAFIRKLMFGALRAGAVGTELGKSDPDAESASERPPYALALTSEANDPERECPAANASTLVGRPGRVRLFFYLPPIPGGPSGLGALLSGNYINLRQRQS